MEAPAIGDVVEALQSVLSELEVHQESQFPPGEAKSDQPAWKGTGETNSQFDDGLGREAVEVEAFECGEKEPHDESVSTKHRKEDKEGKRGGQHH